MKLPKISSRRVLKRKNKVSSSVNIEKKVSIPSTSSNNSYNSSMTIDSDSSKKDIQSSVLSDSDASSSSVKHNNQSSSEAFFANIVASALNDFFEIDKSLIESRLRHTARISLNSVRILPRIVHRTEKYEFELNGVIDSCTLNWKWSVKKQIGSSPVKNVSLTIEGLNIQLEPRIIESDKDNCSTNITNPKNKNMKDKENAKIKENWTTKMIKQILDDIALRIVDARIAVGVEVPVALNSRHIVLLLKNVELDSLGRKAKAPKQSWKPCKEKDSSPLLQRFRVGSISSHVEINDDKRSKNMLPLIDPFRYRAYINKFYGDRFGGGLKTGYDVSGDTLRQTSVNTVHVSSSINTNDKSQQSQIVKDNENVCHAVEINSSNGKVETKLPKPPLYQSSNLKGEEQEFPEKYLYLSNKEDDIANDVIHVSLGADQVDAIMTLFSNLRIPPPSKKSYTETNKHELRGHMETFKAAGILFHRSTRNLTKESKFELPLEAISVELPNGTILSIPHCRLTKNKGETASVIFSGKDGVMVNHKIFFEYGREYLVNFGDKTIICKELMVDETTFNDGCISETHELKCKILRMELSMLQSVTKGLTEITDIYRARVPPPPEEPEKRWSVKLEGDMELIL